MTPVLQTERLRLRPFALTDTAFIIDLLNSPGWLEFIGDRHVKTEEEATAYLQNGPMKSFDLYGYGLCLVERREDGVPVGMCGVFKRDNLEKPDIGFAFLPQYSGAGYAYEIASATMEHAREVLKLPEIWAITVPQNERSIKLLQKIGLRYAKTFRFPGSEQDLLLYSTEVSET